MPKKHGSLVAHADTALSERAFYFAGSEPSLLVDMFNSANRPFYQSTFTLHLESIPLEKYIEFVKMHFCEHGKVVDAALVEIAYHSLKVLHFTCKC